MHSWFQEIDFDVRLREVAQFTEGLERADVYVCLGLFYFLIKRGELVEEETFALCQARAALDLVSRFVLDSHYILMRSALPPETQILNNLSTQAYHSSDWLKAVNMYPKNSPLQLLFNHEQVQP